MKKKLTILLLVLACLVSLAGCSEQTRTERTEMEPDTGSRTLTRTIDEKQTIVYRFHAERTMMHPSLYFAVFDKDVESFRQADNWCTVHVGYKSSASYTTFDSGHAAGLPEEECWTPASKSDTWTMLLPYRNIDDVKEADLELTITRSGDMLKAILAVDGAKVWRAQETIKGLSGETAYLYVYSDHYDLTNVEFQDLGGTGWVIPGWARTLLTAAALVAAFGIHLLGTKLERRVLDVEFAALITGGFFLCAAALVLLIVGRSRPNILGVVGYSPFLMPSGGPGFWIPAIIFGVACAAFLAYLILIEYINPIVCVLCTPLCGLFHMPLLCVAVSLLLFLLEQLFGVILGIVCIIFFYFVFTSPSNTKRVEVYKTTRVYNEIGNLVDARFDIGYIDLPDKDAGKK